MVLRAVASPSSAASAISACRPCPKTGHFGVPTSGKLVSVPQNRAFWGPEPRKTHLRTPKTAILGSRTQKNALPCPKTCHFGVPKPGKRPSVPQNLPFWDPEPGKSRFRWAKQAFLPIHGRENAAPLGKTGTFVHPRQGKQHFVGQNRHFCPSVAEKTALRWAKQGFLPIHGRENRQRRVKEPGQQGRDGVQGRLEEEEEERRREGVARGERKGVGGKRSGEE